MTIYNREDYRTVLPQLEKKIAGLLDMFYPVGSYYETTDAEFDPNKSMGGEWEYEPPRGIINNNANVTVNTAKTYTMCSIRLEPNTKYIVHAAVSSSISSTSILMCQMSVANTYKSINGRWYSRGTMSAGGGTSAWGYIETNDNGNTITLMCYGYNTSSHTESGSIIAIPIDRALDKHRWHRVK